MKEVININIVDGQSVHSVHDSHLNTAKKTNNDSRFILKTYFHVFNREYNSQGIFLLFHSLALTVNLFGIVQSVPSELC